MSDEDPRSRPADPAGTKPKVDPGSLVPRRALPVTSSAVEVDPRAPDADATTDDGHDLLPERLARAGAPALGAAPVRPPHQGRFQFVRGGLIAVALAAIAGIVAIVLAGTGDGGDKVPWSTWKPTSSSLSPAASQIASHIGAEYKLTASQQLVVVTGGPLQLSGAGIDGGGLPLQIALAHSGDYSLIGGETVLYRLCGLGPKCAIAKGKASTERHLLLRRESLELSLYTFRYVKDVSNVVVFMPPKLGDDPSEALFFRKHDVSTEVSRPLAETLPGTPPLPNTVDSRPDASFVDRFTTSHLFSFSLTQANQDNSAFLVLEPFQSAAG
ncbi:MAG TPA: hypothetical protein VHB30_05395 [Solirubrobacteraceae bacterium]|nr:hypothetical protein [Solirubrobacteraceae bacterium]